MNAYIKEECFVVYLEDSDERPQQSIKVLTITMTSNGVVSQVCAVAWGSILSNTKLTAK